LIHWLSAGGEFDDTSHTTQLGKLLQRMLHSGSTLKAINGKTYLSKKPKQEAACGLIVSGNILEELQDDEGNPIEDLLISGEACQINGKSFAWNERLIFPSHVDAIQVSSNLEKLKAFLVAFHESIATLKQIKPLKRFENESYIENLWSSTLTKVNESTVNIKGDVEDIREEPPFILGLKALLEVLGDEWKRLK